MYIYIYIYVYIVTCSHWRMVLSQSCIWIYSTWRSAEGSPPTVEWRTDCEKAETRLDSPV